MRHVLFAIFAQLFVLGAMCTATTSTGHSIGNDFTGLQLGGGSPAATCLPGHSCGVQDQLRQPRLAAGDGNPTPTCIPGHTCGDQDQLQQSVVTELAMQSRLELSTNDRWG